MNKAVAKWNSLNVSLENGYKVSYDLTVTPPKYSDSEIKNAGKEAKAGIKGWRAKRTAKKDKESAMRIENREVALENTKSFSNNLYLRNQVSDYPIALQKTKVDKAYDPYIKNVVYENGSTKGIGGFVVEKKYMTMAIWRDESLKMEDRNQADNSTALWHEIGHFLGLDDKGGTYYADDTIMDYSHPSFSKNEDTKNIGEIETLLILKYAKENFAIPVTEVNNTNDSPDFRKMSFKIKQTE
jgi:hypothetical protein